MGLGSQFTAFWEATRAIAIVTFPQNCRGPRDIHSMVYYVLGKHRG
ncbi:hypothetical protein CGLO_17198 [Colletotrichum gloeosporioides Cg-14]|uniref:Uncharacterized protein n=1 Tax=Colletotrichum gloeosporioides (strain Cg-14) TaxID=1237896 RepID=T0JU60_COLGC|nr:hypothetical protein CGLO_17198 [Colletotrichum gloeosporioides Cg-14]